jgi:hypothetical protein
MTKNVHSETRTEMSPSETNHINGIQVGATHQEMTLSQTELHQEKPSDRHQTPRDIQAARIPVHVTNVTTENIHDEIQ